MIKSEMVLNAIFKAIDEINLIQPDDQKLERSVNSIIMDRNGKLDSLGLVNFVVVVEQMIEKELGTLITLTDEVAFSQPSTPFKTVGTLADYVCKLLEEVPHGR